MAKSSRMMSRLYMAMLRVGNRKMGLADRAEKAYVGTPGEAGDTAFSVGEEGMEVMLEPLGLNYMEIMQVASHIVAPSIKAMAEMPGFNLDASLEGEGPGIPHVLASLWIDGILTGLELAEITRKDKRKFREDLEI